MANSILTPRINAVEDPAGGPILASASQAGGVSTGTQTIAGNKTFGGVTTTAALIANGLVTLAAGLAPGSVPVVLGNIWFSGNGTLDVGPLLSARQAMIVMILNHATAPTTSTAIYLAYKDTAGTFFQRSILASDAQGNNSSSITWTGSVLQGAQGGGGSAGSIMYLRLN